ncbi:amidase [Oceanobacillus piezotolerans]|uniref:Amidase n=1 Tax=Oceanobacillus piezotolerans TaxID=2448030 RepID=A0A498DE42_9BACI|nr:amidase [Oceanobacillus piezotolerans]RLL48472.1 amidase [Oceanobacillus piezotolerans]
MANEIVTKSVEELAPLIKNKEISPVELAEAVLNRAEETNEKTNAYISIYRDEAIENAKKAEEEIRNGNYLGMYHGIPMGIKDNVFFKDKLTTLGSKIHKDYVPSYDATIVEKLRDAGVIFTGKLNLHEYALSITSDNPYYGAVRNPWDLEKTPGGSSGGSGAAVAVGASIASIGTDTAGSIRIPAAACGIVGLKPTRGLVSTHGVFPLSWTQDHVGPMTKTVKDAAGLLEIIAGHDQKNAGSMERTPENFLDQITGDVKDLVIGVDEEYFFNNIDSNIEKSVRDTIQTLVDQGAKVETVEIPAMKDADWAGFTFSVSEASAVHYRSIIERPEDFGEDIRGFLVSGAFPSSKQYADAVKVKEQLTQDFNEIFKNVDVLISPTLPVMPNKIGDEMVDLNGEQVPLLPNFIRLTNPLNIIGTPTLSVPCGWNGNMPVGIQITGPAFADGRVLNTGYAIEKLNLLGGKRPSL